jgi:hypothetical protein
VRYAFLTSGPSDRAKALVVPDHVDSAGGLLNSDIPKFVKEYLSG